MTTYITHFCKSLVFLMVFGCGQKEDQSDIPALLPFPQSVQWTEDDVSLGDHISISYTDGQVEGIADQLSDYFGHRGITSTTGLSQSPDIVLQLGKQVQAGNNTDEAYTINVGDDRIEITASTTTGLFWAIQTLRQLIIDKDDQLYVKGCKITDWPAFQLRGVMHDVGRNFISLDKLREHIIDMSSYKLNVFHWHLTENIAWRLESKKYPQLTDPEFAIRNPGKFYSQEEVRSFLAFCRQHYVTVIPEIDMPGHSDSFTRAMGFEMQSTQGTKVCKELLHEACELFDGPYMHIGSDEVRIDNEDFLPQMFEVIRQHNMTPIGWRPGGTLAEDVVEQLWTGSPAPAPGKKSIDSRHLYLNHNDPLAGVVKIFNRQILDSDQGNEELLGAILCNWPDRKVLNEEALFTQNAINPSMLVFAERTWQGGGSPEQWIKIGPENSSIYQDFDEFENRLIHHRNSYFSNKDFPYIKQSRIRWKILGPYPNQKDLAREFAPEYLQDQDLAELPYVEANGGTIWLRHCWDNARLKSYLAESEPYRTAYGLTYVWSPHERKAFMWIGFHDPSRSELDRTPEEGKWGYYENKIWINNELIPAPQWRNPGMKGNTESPLTDETYVTREPTAVKLKKGWNKILVKAPIGSFEPSENTRLVKWMFTAALFNYDGRNYTEIEGIKYSLTAGKTD